MLNSIHELGDEGGEGHFVSMTPFDDGAVVLSSFNPDDGSRQDVVLMKEQWRKVIELAIAAYGRQHCAYNSGPGRCSAGRNALCTEPC